MNILVVSQMYYPDDFRINEITRALAADGHTVRVLTGLPDYATSRIPKAYRFGRLRRETVEGVQVVRVPTVARRKGLFFRVVNYLSFVVSGWLYAKCTRFRADVVFSYETSPVLQVIPAIAYKKRHRVPLVIYCCDIWPECLKVWGVKESAPLFRWMKGVSRRIFNAGDRVAITSPPFEEYLKTVNGVPAEKLVLLPQHAEDLCGDIAGVYEYNGCTDFLFAGNIGAAQGVETIVQAAAQLKAQTDAPFHVHVVGDGSSREACEQLAAALDVTDCLTFHGKYPLAEMARFYRLADVLLLTMTGDAVGRLTLPAKWQGYLSAGKPLAVAADGVCAEMTRLADCGLAVPAADAAGLAGIMQEMMASPARFHAQGANGRRFYEEHFTKETFMTALYAILKF